MEAIIKPVEEPLKHQWYNITKSTADMLRRLNVCMFCTSYKGKEKTFQVHAMWIESRIKPSPIFKQVIIDEEAKTLTLVLVRGANKWKVLKLSQKVETDHDSWGKEAVTIYAEYTPATDILDIRFEDDKWKETKRGSMQWMLRGTSLEKYCKMMANVTEYRNQFMELVGEQRELSSAETEHDMFCAAANNEFIE